VVGSSSAVAVAAEGQKHFGANRVMAITSAAPNRQHTAFHGQPICPSFDSAPVGNADADSSVGKSVTTHPRFLCKEINL
jgi:hypothetical protein